MSRCATHKSHTSNTQRGIIGQGGYPPCMLDGELKYYELLLEKIYRSDDHDKQFYKADRCSECSFDPYCVGVRRQYIDTYGDDEIKPFQVKNLPGTGGESAPPRSTTAG